MEATRTYLLLGCHHYSLALGMEHESSTLANRGVKCSSCPRTCVKNCPTFSLREKKTSPRPFAPFRPLSIFRSKSEFSPSMAYQSRQPLSTSTLTKRPPWRISPVDQPKFTVLDRRLERREGASAPSTSCS